MHIDDIVDQFLTQSTGRIIGAACGALSVGCASISAVKFHSSSSSSLAAWSTAGGALIGMAWGAWLWFRLYLKDPAARLKYQHEIQNELTFSKACAKFGAYHVADLIGVQESRRRCLLELGPADDGAPLFASKALAIHGKRQLRSLVDDAKILSVTEVVDWFHSDLSLVSQREWHAGRPFSQLWRRFDDGVGLSDLAEVLQSSFDVDGVRQLFHAEFPLSSVVAPRPTVASAALGGATAPVVDDEVVDPVTDDTIARVIHYGDFAQRILRVPTSALRRLVRESPAGVHLPYSTLLTRHRLHAAFRKHWIEAEWCTVKLEEELAAVAALAARRADDRRECLARWWWSIEDNATSAGGEGRVSFETQLTCNMITRPDVLRDAFTASIPADSPFVNFTATPPSPRNSIVDFLQRYESMIRVYGHLMIDRRVWPALLKVQTDWEQAKSSIEAAHPTPPDPRLEKKGKVLTAGKLESEGSNAAAARVVEEDSKRVAEYEQLCSDITKKRRAALMAAKQRIQKAFAVHADQLMHPQPAAALGDDSRPPQVVLVRHSVAGGDCMIM